MPEVTSMRYNVRGTLLTKCTILINRVKPQSCTGAFIQTRTAGKSSESTPQLGMGAIRQDQTRHRLTRRLVEIGRGSLRRSATRSSGEHAAETWNVCRDKKKVEMILKQRRIVYWSTKRVFEEA